MQYKNGLNSFDQLYMFQRKIQKSLIEFYLKTLNLVESPADVVLKIWNIERRINKIKRRIKRKPVSQKSKNYRCGGDDGAESEDFMVLTQR